MKAIICTRYGPPDVLQLKEVAKPTVGDDQVLINVQATSVNAGDRHLMRGDPFLVRLMFGLSKPKQPILGTDVAGRIEAVGKNITQFRPGDEVFGDLSDSGFGAFAQYVCTSEKALTQKPASMTFEEVAAVPSASVTALQGLRDKGGIQSGQQVLITGASGGVGTFAVQIAKSFGAEVTAVCSTSKIDMVRSIGADHVIDYKREDVTQGQQRYDLILDAAAYRSIRDYQRILQPKGTYVLIGGSMKNLFQAMLFGPLLSKTSGQKIGNMLVQPNTQDLRFMRDLLESGKVKPVIDKRYPLREVPQAMRYFESRQAQGKIVITVD
ncbi:MAG: NAD(P)-dependent alcohol dehydrogenase [Chloroflexaceae bacterium]|nr:NAD(P)-dependent alcohol dehydrogenase [Chloroflexaceae bacterium]